MLKLEADPSWTGERAAGSGAPRKTTEKQDREIEEFVLAERGKQKVTVRAVKRKFPALRKLSDDLVEARLHEAELACMPRRKKCKVGKMYLSERIAYCLSVKRKHQSTLLQWAYADGTCCTISPEQRTRWSRRGRPLWAQASGGARTVEMPCLRIASGPLPTARGRARQCESGECWPMGAYAST